MNWKKYQTIVALIVGLLVIGGAVYKFDICKVEKEAYAQFVSATQTQFLEQHRRYIQQRIWDMQTRYPQTYTRMPEYLQLVQELKNIDMKINAYYQHGGG